MAGPNRTGRPGRPAQIDGRRRQGRGGIGALWQVFLPAAILAIGWSVLASGGDPAERPIWIFGAGLVCGVVGAISLAAGLIRDGRRDRAERAARYADAPTPTRPTLVSPPPRRWQGSDSHEP